LSLTLREELRLKVLGNKVLRRIFGLKRDEVTGSWRKLFNEELRNVYSSPNVITVAKSRRMRWAGHLPECNVLFLEWPSLTILPRNVLQRMSYNCL
jgi:hypothetical protein